jgi:hypothetical protein
MKMNYTIEIVSARPWCHAGVETYARARERVGMSRGGARCPFSNPDAIAFVSQYLSYRSDRRTPCGYEAGPSKNFHDE